ncbi:MAG: hypothetical protein AB7J35_06015 [Dehalococcoidia bacterium]
MSMMFIGYQTATPDWPYDILRDTGAYPPALAKKVNEFPSKLPKTCKLIASYGVSGPAPNVVIVEAESIDDLVHIDVYYAGWILFDWHPCRAMPRDM